MEKIKGRLSVSKLAKEPFAFPCNALALSFLYPNSAGCSRPVRANPLLLPPCPGQAREFPAVAKKKRHGALVQDKPQSLEQLFPPPLLLRRLSNWPAGAKEGRKKTLGCQAFPQGRGKNSKVSGLVKKKVAQSPERKSVGSGSTGQQSASGRNCLAPALCPSWT